MAILNKRFGDAGLKDVLIQSSVVAERSVDAALRGKQYNRGIRLYKIFYEALQRLVIQRICDTLDEADLDEIILKIQDHDTVTRVMHQEIMESESYNKFLQCYFDIKIE